MKRTLFLLPVVLMVFMSCVSVPKTADQLEADGFKFVSAEPLTNAEYSSLIKPGTSYWMPLITYPQPISLNDFETKIKTDGNYNNFIVPVTFTHKIMVMSKLLYKNASGINTTTFDYKYMSIFEAKKDGFLDRRGNYIFGYYDPYSDIIDAMSISRDYREAEAIVEKPEAFVLPQLLYIDESIPFEKRVIKMTLGKYNFGEVLQKDYLKNVVTYVDDIIKSYESDKNAFMAKLVPTYDSYWNGETKKILGRFERPMMVTGKGSVYLQLKAEAELRMSELKVIKESETAAKKLASIKTILEKITVFHDKNEFDIFFENAKNPYYFTKGEGWYADVRQISWLNDKVFLATAERFIFSRYASSEDSDFFYVDINGFNPKAISSRAQDMVLSIDGSSLGYPIFKLVGILPAGW